MVGGELYSQPRWEMIHRHWKLAPGPALSYRGAGLGAGRAARLKRSPSQLVDILRGMLVPGTQLAFGPQKRKACWGEFPCFGGAVRD